MPTSTCPPPEKLEDLRANRLGQAEADAVRRHLAECDSCRAGVLGSPPTSNRFPFLSPPRAAGELGWLGDHRVKGVLGEGGMSIVFDAEDDALHRAVALKVLKPAILDDVTRERFLREARVAARLTTEHIVTIHRVGEANGVPYLTMERLEGESLDARLRRDRWLPVGEAMKLARQVAEGLEVAHASGLVHRDIKPANLWLESKGGQFRRVKLIDFGIARVLAQDGLTQRGMLVGTPGYMSPEQAAGLPADARSDLYSLGCVMFHMLTGSPPFAGGGDTMATLAAAVRGETPRVQEVAPQLPPPVAALIQQLLSPNPADRPAAAHTVTERLRQFEQADGYDRGPVNPLATTAPPQASGRQPGKVGIWVGLVALLLAVAVAVSVVVFSGRFFRGNGDAGVPSVPSVPTVPAHPTGPGGPAGPPIKIGLLLSQSGQSSVHEKPILQALELAVKEVQDGGGVLGRPVQFVIGDGASDEVTFAKEAERLIEKEGVAAVFGCWSSASRKLVAPVCEKHDRLLFYPAVYEGLEHSPRVVYLGGTPNQTILQVLRYNGGTLHKKRLFLVGSEQVYSRAVAEYVAHEAKAGGVEIVGQRYVPLGEGDFEKVAKEIVDVKADLVLNTIDGMSNQGFYQDLRGEGVVNSNDGKVNQDYHRPLVEKGITLKPVPTVWVNVSESELSLYHDGLEGDYSVANYFESIPDASNQAFLKRFRDKFGSTERVSDGMQTAYFGVHLWKKAVEKAGTTDTAAVAHALLGMTIDAPEGPVRMDKATLHAWRIPRVGRVVRTDKWADFKMVVNPREPLPPDPFPDWRPRPDWDKFLNGLYVGWGNRWEQYDTPGKGGGR